MIFILYLRYFDILFEIYDFAHSIKICKIERKKSSFHVYGKKKCLKLNIQTK